MQILQKTSNSVLWLLEENDSIKENLLKEVRKYDIEESRIIFAKPVDPRDYLSRFQCADLFLDTSPYNAGITGSDAIWMGLPLLTCPGNTFVSRMAASLLIQLGLNDFVCHDWNEYINKAVQFCESRTGARMIFDRHFDRNHPIFSSEVFVKNLEAKLLQTMKDHYKKKAS
jgi:predicted O-linked N-acetylglucosamine transferase (SPINDLY family)